MPPDPGTYVPDRRQAASLALKVKKQVSVSRRERLTGI
jgi:hypothetical protein